MFYALRPLTILQPLIRFRSISPSNLKWASSISQNPTSQNSIDLKHNLNLLLEGLKDQNHQNIEFELVSALKSCSSLFDVSQADQIHCLVRKSGLDSNIFVQNSLINLYVKCGCIQDAHVMFDSCPHWDNASWNTMIVGYVKLGRVCDAYGLFDRMPGKDCVSYTTMIMGLSQNDQHVEALKVFKEMEMASVVPNEVTMASVISAYSNLGGTHGSMLHTLAIKFGLSSFTLVSTNLILVYSKSSKLRDAKIVFDDMRERNVVTWNVMLNGYSKAGLVDEARLLFERMTVRDLVSWSTMIDAYVQADKLVEALVTFRDMFRAGIRTNEVMIVNLLSACGRRGAIDYGQQFHCMAIKTGMDCYDFLQATMIHFYAGCAKIELACLQFDLGSKDNISSWNALVAGFVRNGMVDSARQVFDTMAERDVVSWSTMIAGYSQIEESDATLQLFHQMLSCGIRPNEVTMVSVLSAVANSGRLSDGRWVHDYINKNSIPLNDNLSAGLIDMYAKCGSINNALELFSQVQSKANSASPWNAVICGLAMHGLARESLRVFTDMQKTCVSPNSITFIGVLNACCHAGLVEAGEQYYNSMRRLYNIEPNIKHYGCMVDLLGRAGRLAEAEQLIARMPMKPDFVIWGTLLAACRIHGNVEVGERAAENLARLDPAHGAGRILLSNIYANSGRWDDVLLVRRAIQDQRMNRTPGRSIM
ncbi:hypothetical protein Syun_007669 [Stephania yunnanensis]|uniref:Pentatricopeptide repeat-containing protein n=1 Tax=Stephania yunnanensis TaxID=152371 RepID=A0AAP0L0D1_9MAGN